MWSDIDDMIVHASLNDWVMTLRRVQTIGLWRAMGDDIERRILAVNGLQWLFVGSIASIAVLMSLQHKFCLSFSDDVVEHPSLYEVIVLPSHGIKWMMEEDNAMTGIRLLYLLLQPFPLTEEIEELTL